MVPHLFGQPADMASIVPLAQKHNLKIIEDSCETMFARYNNKPVGSWGDIACFSTYTAHLIATGVGGIATTNNVHLARLIKSLFNHGRNNIYLSLEDDDKTNSSGFKFILKNRFNFIHVGYSYRMTEMEAALGLAQLEQYEKIIKPRQKNAHYLSEKLKPLASYLRTPQIRERAEHVFMVYPLVIMDKKIRRDDLLLYLEKKGIETRYLLPLINQPVYKHMKIPLKEFPIASLLNNYGFYIGCHQALKKDDLDFIVTSFFEYFAKKKWIK